MSDLNIEDVDGLMSHYFPDEADQLVIKDVLEAFDVVGQKLFTNQILNSRQKLVISSFLVTQMTINMKQGLDEKGIKSVEELLKVSEKLFSDTRCPIHG